MNKQMLMRSCCGLRRTCWRRGLVRFQGIDSGDRGGQKSSGGMVGPPEPGTSRYAVGLVIPHPVARLQSRTPLHQAAQL
jgi:hypothetical protein